MSSLTSTDGVTLTHDERVQAMMEIFHVDEVTAEFMIAIEDGEISGDVIELDADGNAVIS